MKAWQVTNWCEPEQMVLADVPLPEPSPGQVRVRVRAAALNFFDILQIQGKYQVKPPLPFTPGAEAGGIVDALGSGVSGLSVGDSVIALTMGGAFAEFALADTVRVFSTPPGMGFAEAAALGVVYHTSWFALERRAMLRAGEWLLVHAGASGVGMSAIQIGKALGARVIATAGSEDKLAFCRTLGADHVLDYRDGAWVDEVKRISVSGADVIYDPVGGDVFDLSTRCIAPQGRLLVIGFASGRIPSIAANRILLKNISIVGAIWGNYVQSNPGYLAEAQAALDVLYRAGKIRPVVGKTYPLEEAPRALRDLAERKILGKAALLLP